MLRTEILLNEVIANPAEMGTYWVRVYFKDPSKSKYINIGDLIEDASSASMAVTSATLPLQDGEQILVTAASVPLEDTDYYSTIFTSGQQSYNPAFKTSGVIHHASIGNPMLYEYYIMATWDGSYQENSASIGDSVVDGNGKEFTISYIDPVQRFNTFFKAIETHKTGDLPTVGDGTLYRSTPNYGLHQGKHLDDDEYSVIIGRDAAILDRVIGDLRSDLDSVVVASGGDKTFVHDQQVAIAVWNIVHSLDKFPSVSVVDSGGTAVVGEVEYTDTNNCTLTFSAPFSGKAFFN